jgi:hypothetical protein
MPDISEKTSCYTYKIELVVQVLAKDQIAATRKVDAEGGYVTSRKVTLLNTVPVHEVDNK